MLQEQYEAETINAAMASLDSFRAFSGMVTDAVVASYGEGSEEAESAQKALFAVTQAVALAQAIINMAVAISQANASAPAPYNIPAIAAAAITGGVQIGTIVGTTIAGLADAGLTPEMMLRVAGSGHSAIAVRGDEMVLDPIGTKHISDMLAMQKASMSARQPQRIETTVELDGEIVGKSIETFMVSRLERGIDYRSRSRTGAPGFSG